MKNKHYIYEIFGRKVGVTNDVARRMKQQGVKEGEYRVIEEHTNAKTASIRERELQEQHGYRVDNIPYWKTLQNNKKAQTPQAQAKRVANTNWKAKVANTDYKAIVAKIDYKARTAKIDYKAIAAKIDYKTARIKGAANTEKSILQFDKQGNFIKQWDSAKKAAKELNLHSSGINMCLRGKYKTAGSYVWKYAN
jgi:hypothetical protein